MSPLAIVLFFHTYLFRHRDTYLIKSKHICLRWSDESDESDWSDKSDKSDWSDRSDGSDKTIENKGNL